MDPLQGVSHPLPARKLTQETCEKWGVTIVDHPERLLVFPYYGSDGALVAQKTRTMAKDFKVRGSLKDAHLFGQKLWRDGGKMVVVCEGEIDAMTVSQMQGHKWPVVSIPNGAQGAKKALQHQLEWLSKFETVVLMFDMDDVGQKYAKECSDLFKPGTCKLASLLLKDPNELLQAGRGDEIIAAIWSAKVHRPDGIIDANDLLASILATPAVDPFIPFPWAGLSDKIQGLRRGELVTICAGSGIGKSTYCRELAYYLNQRGERVGYLALEENVKRTTLGILSCHLNKRLHLSREGVTDDQIAGAFAETFGRTPLYLYSSFGSTAVENLLNRIRYLAKGCDCGWIVLDHLSIVISGLGDGDERRLIDNAMTMLRTLVEETGIGLLLVSHLKRPPEGKSFNAGRHVGLSDLRGSAAIEQLSDVVLGIERNQEDPENRNRSTIRVLKHRPTGYTGAGTDLIYNQDTGRLAEETLGSDL